MKDIININFSNLVYNYFEIEVKDVATDILEQWKEVVRKETGGKSVIITIKLIKMVCNL